MGQNKYTALEGAIKARRLNMGLTQEELAEKAQLSPRTIERLETKGWCATISTFVRIAKVFDCDPRDIADLPQIAEQKPSNPLPANIADDNEAQLSFIRIDIPDHLTAGEIVSIMDYVKYITGITGKLPIIRTKSGSTKIFLALTPAQAGRIITRDNRERLLRLGATVVTTVSAEELYDLHRSQSVVIEESAKPNREGERKTVTGEKNQENKIAIRKRLILGSEVVTALLYLAVLICMALNLKEAIVYVYLLLPLPLLTLIAARYLYPTKL
jgi:transcriptional regulator with XRE-family HTH domain